MGIGTECLNPSYQPPIGGQIPPEAGRNTPKLKPSEIIIDFILALLDTTTAKPISVGSARALARVFRGAGRAGENINATEERGATAMTKILGTTLALAVMAIFISSAQAINISSASVQSGLAVVQGGKAAANANILWEGGNVAKANKNGGFSPVWCPRIALGR
jgi:hypothetical protein